MTSFRLSLSVCLSLRLCGAALLLGAGAACTSAPVSIAQSTPLAPRSPLTDTPGLTLMQQIEQEIGAASCDSTIECRTLGVGQKACGGPESYVAWSIQDSDSARLATLAERLATARKSANNRAGMISTCSVVPDPGAVCLAGRCVLQKNTLGAPVAR
jgi:hypothetical protein